MGLDFCNETDINRTLTLMIPQTNMKSLYVYLCPVVIFVCFFSIIFNAILMSISRQSKFINKSPILLLSLNLAVTDLIASVLNGLNILFNSYLPNVFDIRMGRCVLLTMELFRCSALLASALHLLALAFVHYRGTVNPLHYRSSIFYSRHLSRTINIISICCWLLPLTLMIVWFSSTPCQGFQTAQCDFFFLLGFTFRYMILTVFSVPLLLMSIIYLRIFLLISRHQKGRMLPAVAAASAATTAVNLSSSQMRAAGIEAGGGPEDKCCKLDSGNQNKQEPQGQRQHQRRLRCPVCSSPGGRLEGKGEVEEEEGEEEEEEEDDDDDGAQPAVESEVESASILSEEIESSGGQPLADDVWTRSGRASNETAALMGGAKGNAREPGANYSAIIQQRNDDSYTIRNNGSNNNNAKSRCNGIRNDGQAAASLVESDRNSSGRRPADTGLVTDEDEEAYLGQRGSERRGSLGTPATTMATSSVLTSADIDNDPNRQPRKQALVFLLDFGEAATATNEKRHDAGVRCEDDHEEADAANEMMPAELNCERQTSRTADRWQRLVGGDDERRRRASPPLADHANAAGSDRPGDGVSFAAPMQTTTTKSPRSGSCRTSGRNGTSQLSDDATAPPLHRGLSADASGQAPTRSQLRRHCEPLEAKFSSLCLSMSRGRHVNASDSLCTTGIEPSSLPQANRENWQAGGGANTLNPCRLQEEGQEENEHEREREQDQDQDQDQEEEEDVARLCQPSSLQGGSSPRELAAGLDTTKAKEQHHQRQISPGRWPERRDPSAPRTSTSGSSASSGQLVRGDRIISDDSGGGWRQQSADRALTPNPQPIGTCTCDNKLNHSTIKSLGHSNTVAMSGTGTAAPHRPGTTATTKTTTTTTRPKAPVLSRDAKSSISSSFAAASPSLRFQLARSPTSPGPPPESASGSTSRSSESSSSCERVHECPRRSAGASVRARLLRQTTVGGDGKPSSLHVTGPTTDGASLTVTTLNSGHPAHNFSSASSFHTNQNHTRPNHHKHHHRHHHHHHHHHHHEPQRLHVHKAAVPPTNTKALVTTLLILGTYFVSYLPAILFQVLTCIDSHYCPYPLYEVTTGKRLVFGTMTTLLLIAKSIVDPLIYSYRMNEIKMAISRYMSKRRSKSSSRATSLYTSQRLTLGGGGGGGGGQATQQTNFNTSSFRVLSNTNASIKSPSSRATSIRVNQHHFDRPPLAVSTRGDNGGGGKSGDGKEEVQPAMNKLALSTVAASNSTSPKRDTQEGGAQPNRTADRIQGCLRRCQ